MIEDPEILEFAERFGVPADQIRRDHLISHILASLGSANQPGDMVFFGGTALCRTWLPDLRLSEDIDLLVDSMEAREQLQRSISLGLRQEFPSATWTKVDSKHDVETWNLAALAEANMIDRNAVASVHAIAGHTPTSRSITNVAMSRVRNDWNTELDHQLGDPKSLDECVELVRSALDAISST